MSLPVPKEPKEIKEWIKSLRDQTFHGPGVNWDSLAIWAFNKLPQYLWNEWKDELKPRGLTWQKFLKLLKTRTDIFLYWYKGVYSWEQLIKDLTALIDGPLGEDIVQKK